VTGVDHEQASPSAPVRHRLRDLVAFPVGAYLAVAAVLVVVVWASTRWLDPNIHYPVTPPTFPGSSVLGGWFRFDGGWYELIAREGYWHRGPGMQSPVAFFPAYRLVMRAVAPLLGDGILAGMAVTALSGLAATVLVHRWTADRLGESCARWTVATLLVYPYAWYLFGAVYADALFVFAVVGAFVLLERDHTVLDGLAGAVATAARPVGIAVVVGLVAVLVERRGGPGRLGGLRPADAGVLLFIGGLAAWSGYLWARWGDPLLFATVQEAPGWGQQAGPRTWFKVELVEKLRALPGVARDALAGTTVTSARPWEDTVYTTGVLVQAVLIVVALGLVVAVWHRIGWGYGIYCLTVLAVPLVGTKDFQGVGRYVLAAFPCFAVVGAALAGHRRARWWLAVSAVGLVVLASFYARGSYVA